MEPPRKRQRLDYDAAKIQDIAILREERHSLQLQLKSRFEKIFERFEKDFTGVGDEIDLQTGRVVVDNGHLLHMRNEHDEANTEVRIRWNKDSTTVHPLHSSQLYTKPGAGERVSKEEDIESDSDSLLGELAVYTPDVLESTYERLAHLHSSVSSPLTEKDSTDPRWQAQDQAGLLPLHSSAHVDLANTVQPCSQSPPQKTSVWDFEQPDTAYYVKKHRQTPWNVYTDRLLSYLRGRKKLPYSKLEKFFPGRNAATIRAHWIHLQDRFKREDPHANEQEMTRIAFDENLLTAAAGDTSQDWHQLSKRGVETFGEDVPSIKTRPPTLDNTDASCATFSKISSFDKTRSPTLPEASLVKPSSHLRVTRDLTLPEPCSEALEPIYLDESKTSLNQSKCSFVCEEVQSFTRNWVESPCKDVWTPEQDFRLTYLLEAYRYCSLPPQGRKQAFESIIDDLSLLIDRRAWIHPFHDVKFRHKIKVKISGILKRISECDGDGDLAVLPLPLQPSNLLIQSAITNSSEPKAQAGNGLRANDIIEPREGIQLVSLGRKKSGGDNVKTPTIVYSTTQKQDSSTVGAAQTPKSTTTSSEARSFTLSPDATDNFQTEFVIENPSLPSVVVRKGLSPTRQTYDQRYRHANTGNQKNAVNIGQYISSTSLSGTPVRLQIFHNHTGQVHMANELRISQATAKHCISTAAGKPTKVDNSYSATKSSIQFDKTNNLHMTGSLASLASASEHVSIGDSSIHSLDESPNHHNDIEVLLPAVPHIPRQLNKESPSKEPEMQSDPPNLMQGWCRVRNEDNSSSFSSRITLTSMVPEDGEDELADPNPSPLVRHTNCQPSRSKRGNLTRGEACSRSGSKCNRSYCIQCEFREGDEFAHLGI